MCMFWNKFVCSVLYIIKIHAYDINIDIILKHTMDVLYPTLLYINLFKLYAHVCTYRQKY